MTNHKPIRDALALGPTPGPWTSESGLRIVDAHGNVVARLSATLGKYEYEAINVAYIIACNPDAIAALLRDLDEARAALSAAKGGGWLPIQSAPKDGTEILTYRGAKLVSVAAFIAGGW